MDLRLLDRAARRVGTLNPVILWLRSLALAFGTVALVLVLVGILGQTNVRLTNDAFYVALVVLAIVAAALASMELDRRRVLLEALESYRGEPTAPPPTDGTPA